MLAFKSIKGERRNDVDDHDGEEEKTKKKKKKL